MRKCKKCGIEKTIDQFPRHECGYRYSCRECYYDSRRKRIQSCPQKTKSELESKAKWRRNNPEKQRAAVNKWRSENLYRSNAAAAKHKASKKNATPKWLTKQQLEQIAWFYAAADMMTKTSGIRHNVDHIHPLQGENFSGLHVPWNLQVLKKSENIAKSNKPPSHQLTMFWVS